MKFFSLELVFLFLAFVGLTAAPSIHAAVPGKSIKLVKKKYSCPFICLKFIRAGSHGIIYKGHEKFELYISGSKYEDDFEKRVLGKANLSCKGGDTAKLVDFNSQQFVIADEMGNSKPLAKVTTVKVFSPASHCHVDTKRPKKN